MVDSVYAFCLHLYFKQINVNAINKTTLCEYVKNIPTACCYESKSFLFIYTNGCMLKNLI